MQGSTIIPSARYEDAFTAIDWLCNVFGFTRHAVYAEGTVVHHAQLTLGAGMFMLGSRSRSGEFGPYEARLEDIGGRETVGLCLKVDDIDGVYARAVAAGAEIISDLTEQPYGGRAFACRDCEAHIWWVGTYDPWAATAEGTA